MSPTSGRSGSWMASVSYLANKSTHIWSGNGEINPAVFLGLGACTINGVNYSTCSTTSNTNQRRLLYLANPALGAAYASVNTSGRWRRGSLSRHAAVLAAPLQPRVHIRDELHGLVLRLRHRIRRGAGDAGELAAVQPPCRLGSVRLRYPPQLQHLDGGHQFHDGRPAGG